jgi:hypothetical protein
MILDTSKEIDRNKLFSRLDALLKKNSIIELKEIKKKRTLSQNAYLHVCITLFAIEFGYDLENAKYLLKSACPFMHEWRDDFKVVKQTRKMDTKQLTEFIEWLRNFSSMQGCYIPTPEEYYLNQFEIDKEISKHKEYL